MANVATSLGSMKTLYEQVGGAAGLFGEGEQEGQDKYINQRISELQSVYSLLNGKEQEFYQKFGSLQELQNRIDDIRSLPELNFNSKISQVISVLASEGLVDEAITSKKIIERIEAAINQEADDILRENGQFDEAKRAIGETVQSFLNQKSGANTFSARFKVGQLRIQWKDGKAKIEDEGLKISSPTKKQILQILGEEAASGEKISQEILKQKIVQIVLPQAYNDSRIRFAINNTPLNLSLKGYDVNTSKSSIIGFLGELEFNIIMSILTGGRSVHATGNISRTSQAFQGKSITIDAVVDGFGFQIKNYSIKGGGVTFQQEGKSAGTLLQDRLELDEAIVDLFGSYQYNQGIENPSSEFQELRGKMETFVKERTPQIIKANATKLIGLDNTNFEGDPINNAAASLRGDINTFFYVNGKLLPGSAIVAGLISALEAEKSSKRMAVSVGAQVSGPDPNGVRYGIQNKETPSAKTAANYIKINYSVRINFQKVFAVAENYAASMANKT